MLRLEQEIGGIAVAPGLPKAVAWYAERPDEGFHRNRRRRRVDRLAMLEGGRTRRRSLLRSLLSALAGLLKRHRKP